MEFNATLFLRAGMTTPCQDLSQEIDGAKNILYGAAGTAFFTTNIAVVSRKSKQHGTAPL